jgi:lipoyl(octanoyl) transferase
VLQAYLFGPLDFDCLQRFQRRIVYEAGDDRGRAVVVVCEHPPVVTIGRAGSRSHVRGDFFSTTGWPIRWVNRGGGTLLHLPGQLAIYPVFALDRIGITLQGYLDRLHATLIQTAAECGVSAETGPCGIWAGGRLLAHVGVAVRDWITYYGASLNVNPDLEPFRLVDCADRGSGPMTSLQRERRTPIRASSARLHVLEALRKCFDFESVAVFHSHPALTEKATADAIATRPH